MNKEKVLIIGGGGIIGQHMLLQNKYNYECTITRRAQKSDWWISYNSESDDIRNLLAASNPSVIVNLSGENRVDVVEATPEAYSHCNVDVPDMLAEWCKKTGAYLIQCSTQGVFSGNNATYSPSDNPNPITEYGKQKLLAEEAALTIENSEVARLTFVLGVRPFQNIGRRNPLEDMLKKKNQLQVNDRFFSPLFAEDAADILWQKIINKDNSEKIYHLGNPIRCSRFTIAHDLMYNLNGRINIDIEPVSHEYFVGLAQRPFDTTWANGKSIYKTSFEEGLIKCYWQWRKIVNEH